MMKKGYLNNLIHRKANLIVFFLLVLLFIQAISSIQKKTNVIDEYLYLPSGYTYLKTGQLFVMGHTPMVNIISALPLLFLDLKIPPSLDKHIYNNDHGTYSGEFLYEYNRDKFEQIVFWGRVPIAVLSVLLGLFVFRWSRELYGVKAGLFALFLYSFSPTILSHSGLAITDLGFSCFMFMAMYYFWRFVNYQTSKDLVLTGIAFGLAQVSKFTALSLIPIYFVLIFMFILFYCKKRKSGSKGPKRFLLKRAFEKATIMLYSFIVILVIGLVVINLTYSFQGSFKSLGKNLRDDKSGYFDHDIYNTDSIVGLIPFESKIIKSISHFAIDKLPIIVPYPYLKSLVSIVKQVSAHTPYVYFMGGDAAGIWYTYIILLLIKTPIPTLILLLLSLIFFRRIRSKETLDEYFLVIPPLFIFIYFSFFHPIKDVIHYILPMYPFVFVFISKIINLKIKKQILFYLGIAILCIWYLISSISVYPHYLAYFNEFAGGPDNGYRYLVGTTLDLGQDLKGLSAYVRENNISGLKLAYFGMGNPDYYNIPSKMLKYFADPSFEDCGKQKGIVAVSATYLQGVGLDNRNCFKWLKEYEPIEKIGYSIFIYRIDE